MSNRTVAWLKVVVHVVALLPVLHLAQMYRDGSLAVTSPQRVMRAMGGKKWQLLHRLIYVAGFLALTHFWWQVKGGVRTPLSATLVFWALILARVAYWAWKRWRPARVVPSVPVG